MVAAVMQVANVAGAKCEYNWLPSDIVVGVGGSVGPLMSLTKSKHFRRLPAISFRLHTTLATQ